MEQGLRCGGRGRRADDRGLLKPGLVKDFHALHSPSEISKFNFILSFDVIILGENILVGLAKDLSDTKIIHGRSAILHVDSVAIPFDKLLDLVVNVELKNINSSLVR